MYSLLRFFLLSVIIVAFSAPGWAAEIDDAGTEAAQKKAQILRLFEAQPPSQAVDAAIQSVADSRYKAGDPARDEFISRLQLAVDYDAIEAEAMNVMVGLYSLPELTAMADYYTSDMGRSAEGKGAAFRAKIAPLLKEMLDKGVMSVITSPSPASSAAGH